MALLLKNLLFTVLVPGTVAVYVPGGGGAGVVTFTMPEYAEFPALLVARTRYR